MGDTQWLVYWVVFAAFSVCEFFSDILVGWVPFYWFLKCTFLTWCMSPLNGSATIYNNILLPLFNRNQSKIDNVLNRGKSLVDQGISEAVKIASEVESKKSERYEKFCVPKVKRLLCHTSYLRLNLLIC